VVRAISRNAAMQMNVFNEYTYTLEMIIQAGQKGMAITLYQSERTGIYDPLSQKHSRLYSALDFNHPAHFHALQNRCGSCS